MSMLPVLWFWNWKSKELFPMHLITKPLYVRYTFTMSHNVCLGPYIHILRSSINHVLDQSE